LEIAVDAAFDLERWAAEDCEVVGVVFEPVEDDFEDEPHPLAASERPTAAMTASVLRMVLMMSDRALRIPTVGALDLL
jgi:hypothetical protein